MTYYLLEATLSDCIRGFFTINLFSLINGEALLLYHNRPQCFNWMIRKQSLDPVFDQVNIRLLDAAHRNMNQKYVFF